jgi:hypothetical protein
VLTVPCWIRLRRSAKPLRFLRGGLVYAAAWTGAVHQLRERSLQGGCAPNCSLRTLLRLSRPHSIHFLQAIPGEGACQPCPPRSIADSKDLSECKDCLPGLCCITFASGSHVEHSFARRQASSATTPRPSACPAPLAGSNAAMSASVRRRTCSTPTHCLIVKDSVHMQVVGRRTASLVLIISKLRQCSRMMFAVCCCVLSVS